VLQVSFFFVSPCDWYRLVRLELEWMVSVQRAWWRLLSSFSACFCQVFVPPIVAQTPGVLCSFRSSFLDATGHVVARQKSNGMQRFGSSARNPRVPQGCWNPLSTGYDVEASEGNEAWINKMNLRPPGKDASVWTQLHPKLIIDSSLRLILLEAASSRAGSCSFMAA